MQQDEPEKNLQINFFHLFLFEGKLYTLRRTILQVDPFPDPDKPLFHACLFFIDFSCPCFLFVPA